MIEYEIYQPKELSDELAQIFRDFFELPADITDDVEQFISQLQKDCTFVVEYPYVDKVFRDSFYTYFSSKLSNYPRNCIRVSVFDGKVALSEFREPENHQKLKEQYGGFFVVRPTYPNPIGRTILSQKVLENDDFLNCKTSFPITCSGLKCSVNGFPYSSQDQETISCAETTLWGIMEYFSNRYAKYSPALPSNIIEALQDVRSQRQLPSLGLNVNDLSHALKKFGFGTRIYDRKQFGSIFEGLLSCYVESGIPVIVAMTDKKSFQHATICIGREQIKDEHLKQLGNGVGLTDFDNIRKKFVFMDDNLPPYQKLFLDDPAANYSNSDLQKTKITHFIVPLYSKIYLEAFEAKKFCISFLASNSFKEDTFRILLTSSRSYKDEILRDDNLPKDFKNKILKLPMPKFIWVCELTNKKHLARGKCYGTILLDATEPNINKYKPLIFMHIDDLALYKQKGSLSSDKLKNSLTEYDVYKNNLSGF
jgi:hypothetical protein